MPVFLITAHTFRSWSEDNPRGYVQRGRPGIQPPNPKLAQHRKDLTPDPPVRLSPHQQQLVLNALHEICTHLNTKPYAASCTPTHWHLLVGWFTPISSPPPPTTQATDVNPAPHVNAVPNPPANTGPGFTSGAGKPTHKTETPKAQAKLLATRLKRVVGRKLSADLGTTGHRWFSRGRDLRHVEDQAHFDHLITQYLPKHTIDGGQFERWG